MPNLELLVLPGDGIGPEITAATCSVLDAANTAFSLGLRLTEADIGLRALDTLGTTFPDTIEALARSADGVILGPVSHNVYPPAAQGGHNPSAQLRKRLDLYANIRPARTREGLPAPCAKPFDLVIVRENTEGFYADRSMHLGPGEFMPSEDMALAMRKITRSACRRIAERAYELALQRPARHVTAVHKTNVLRVSDGLFLEEVRKVAATHPEIQYDEVLVDAMTAHLVRQPDRYDVVVTTNMFGDILSDLASELSGSLGLAASLNAGTDYAMAQAQHGSAPDIAGRNLANPASLIGSAGMLLHWLGAKRDDPRLVAAADAIHFGLEAALRDPATRTPDMGGPLSTTVFTQAVIRAMPAG